MDKDYYIKCILDDEKERHFVDYTNKKWFKEFVALDKADYTIDQFFEFISWNDKYVRQSNCEFYNSQDMLDLLINRSDQVVQDILREYKTGHFGNMEELNKKHFVDINIPLIRMMNYFLSKKAFKEFGLVAERLEVEYYSLWFELKSKELCEIIESNIDNPYLLVLFSRLDKESFNKFFKKEYFCILENTAYVPLKKIFETRMIPIEYVNNSFFKNGFKKFSLEQQINLTELLENKELDSNFITELHKLLNKDDKITEYNFKINVFEMSEEKFKKMIETIEKSSYFEKNDVANSSLWLKVKAGYNKDIEADADYYLEITNLYIRCREYATKSIIDSLYPLNTIPSKIYHLTGTFNILARVRTMWEVKELDETFRIRTFCSFSILTEKNMSHYGNSVLYGYYTGVTPESIAHIYPIDSLSNAEAALESELTKRTNMLLDMNDLNQATLERKTYNQLCIRTKSKDGKILHPDCIVCIDELDEKSQEIADEMGLPIVILDKKPDTIENNQDIFADLK